MSIFDNERLDSSIFRIDLESFRRGIYSDKYFENGRLILERLSEKDYRLDYQGSSYDVGSLEVEMQIFHRRDPISVICNSDYALSILESCTGYFEDDRFVKTSDKLDIQSVSDGDTTAPWQAVMKIRGRYRDFAILETPLLGVLSRGSKIATNTYNILKAARGKGVLFFPARFDLPHTQESDGYAYWTGLQRYNHDYKKDVKPLVSTDAQGSWWGGIGGGTVAHAYVICHFKNTAESMINFARELPPQIPRIALVDTNNDCVGDSLRCAELLFKEYLMNIKSGKPEEAEKYKLFGVRLDTASNMIDKSLNPSGEKKSDYGVTPRLARAVRDALDQGWKDLNLSAKDRNTARDFYRDIKIVASGGFNVEKVTYFEESDAPVDLYGIGSSFFSGVTHDFTADVVRVKSGKDWIEMAKDGRHSTENPDLKKIKFEKGKILDV
jgi:nicotinate phosphoribosyltransferase